MTIHAHGYRAYLINKRRAAYDRAYVYRCVERIQLRLNRWKLRALKAEAILSRIKPSGALD